jgi:hypothetical protein
MVRIMVMINIIEYQLAINSALLIKRRDATKQPIIRLSTDEVNNLILSFRLFAAILTLLYSTGYEYRWLNLAFFQQLFYQVGNIVNDYISLTGSNHDRFDLGLYYKVFNSVKTSFHDPDIVDPLDQFSYTITHTPAAILHLQVYRQ